MKFAETLIEQARGPREEVELQLSIAQRARKKSDVSLREAGQDLRVRDAAERKSLLAKVDKTGQEKIAKAEAELRRQQQADAIRVIEAKKKASGEKADTEISDAELLRKAKSGKTRALLAFFMPGRVQADLTETAEKRPFSYNRLASSGALNPTTEGQTKLLHCLVTTYDTDRPIWKKSPVLSCSTSAERDKLEEIQKALIELGPTLVEQKMLDP